MSDLNPEDRALLDLARDGHEPTEVDRTRLRLALLARLGVGTGLAGTTAATSKAATTLVLTKVLTAVVVAGAIGATSVVTYRVTHPAPMRIVATSSTAASQEHPKLPSFVALPPATSDPVSKPNNGSGVRESDVTDAVLEPPSSLGPTAPANATGRSSEEDRSASSAALSPQRAEAPIADELRARGTPLAAWPADPASVAPQEAPATPKVPAARTTLEAETRLVRGGVAALHAGDATRALGLFDEHARAFPNGALAEERAAERVVALGELNRCDEARAAAAEFLRDHPRSPLVARVRESCAHTNP